MSAVCIILCVIGYLLMGGITCWLINLWLNDMTNSMWVGLLWPATLPVIILYLICMVLCYTIGIIARFLDNLVKGKYTKTTAND